ncbi:MAG: class I SAM-dependent methyltransferase [Candidatus Sulfotelmatobacter sp.]
MLPVREIARCVQTGLRSLALGANVSSLRFWSKPRKAYQYWNACLFLSNSMGEGSLKNKQVWEAFQDAPRDAKLHFPALQDSWIWHDPSYVADLVHLGLLCQAVQPRTVFEIGTSTGYSSLFLAANTPPDTQIWTLDLPKQELLTQGSLTLHDRQIIEDCHKLEPCFVGHALGKKIQRIYGDSAKFDFSPYRRSVDLFFVDGAHTYDYVRSDTINALRCCRPGGVIAWHDYRRSGLSRDVNKWLEQLNRIVAVYAAYGSSVAFMSCDFDCEELAGRLGERELGSSANRHAGEQAVTIPGGTAA